MKKEKLEKLREIIPSLWNSYQHMYDIRRTGVQNRSNFLLLIISFLSVISIMLFTHFNNILFFIPFLLQLASFIILLKSYFVKELKVHWFEYKSLFENLDKNEFYQDLFSDLKALENSTYVYMKEIIKVTNISIYLLLISIYSLFFLLTFIYFEEEVLYLSILILTAIFLLLICFYYRIQPKLNYKSDHKEFRNEVDEWIKK